MVRTKPAFTISLPSQKVTVMDEDIDDIMDSAMAGCTYWCSSAEPVGDYCGDYASEQISRGGILRFFPIDDSPVDLNKEKFRDGLCRWFASTEHASRAIDVNMVNPGMIDADDADSILQFALFGELVYS